MGGMGGKIADVEMGHDGTRDTMAEAGWEAMAAVVRAEAMRGAARAVAAMEVAARAGVVREHGGRSAAVRVQRGHSDRAT